MTLALIRNSIPEPELGQPIENGYGLSIAHQLFEDTACTQGEDWTVGRIRPATTWSHRERGRPPLAQAAREIGHDAIQVPPAFDRVADQRQVESRIPRLQFT